MCGQFVHIRIFIQVKNHRNIKNVGGSTDLIAFFPQGREFILVINFMNVRSEGKSPVITHLVNSSHSREVHMPKINVDVPSAGDQTLY